MKIIIFILAVYSLFSFLWNTSNGVKNRLLADKQVSVAKVQKVDRYIMPFSVSIAILIIAILVNFLP